MNWAGNLLAVLHSGCCSHSYSLDKGRLEGGDISHCRAMSWERAGKSGQCHGRTGEDEIMEFGLISRRRREERGSGERGIVKQEEQESGERGRETRECERSGRGAGVIGKGSAGGQQRGSKEEGGEGAWA